jgi:hypothetical protein
VNSDFGFTVFRDIPGSFAILPTTTVKRVT